MANTLVISVVPVEVSNGLLQSEQVVHCSHYNVDCGCVTLLSTQLVLKFYRRTTERNMLTRTESEMKGEKEEEKAVEKKMEEEEEKDEEEEKEKEEKK